MIHLQLRDQSENTRVRNKDRDNSELEYGALSDDCHHIEYHLIKGFLDHPKTFPLQQTTSLHTVTLTGILLSLT